MRTASTLVFQTLSYISTTPARFLPMKKVHSEELLIASAGSGARLLSPPFTHWEPNGLPSYGVFDFMETLPACGRDDTSDDAR